MDDWALGLAALLIRIKTDFKAQAFALLGQGKIKTIKYVG